MNTGRTTMVVKMAGALACLGLAFSGMANAAPAADPGDIPEVDEQFAFDYALEHESELCTLLDDEWTQIGVGRVEGGRVTGRPAADDDHLACAVHARI